jgi:hypothetical protein
MLRRVVQHIVDFMDDMPPLPLVFLYAAVVGPLLALIHEMGHAGLALWRTNGPVVVVIAAKRRLFALRSGRFHVEANQLVQCGGLCAYDPSDASRLDHAAIALAGPLASLLGAAVTAVLWAHTGGALHGLLSVATFGGILAGIVNALPLTYQARRRADAPRVRLDGLQALDALRRPRVSFPAPPPPRDAKAGPVAERWAAEVDAASERARAARARTNASRLRATASERRATSIPPPGF